MQEFSAIASISAHHKSQCVHATTKSLQVDSRKSESSSTQATTAFKTAFQFVISIWHFKLAKRDHISILHLKSDPELVEASFKCALQNCSGSKG